METNSNETKDFPGFISDMQRIYLPNIANIIQAYNSPTISPEWKGKHLERIQIANKLLPHGSGIDGKCEFQPENCTGEKLYIFVEFHHMDENGYYEGWTEHNIILTPSFILGYQMKITGRNKNGIKEYLHDTFAAVLTIDPNE